MQMIERVKEYVQTLSVQDKSGYERRISACVEYFDGEGISTPTDSDWQSCLEHLTADGKLGEKTVNMNHIPQAKKFYLWCISQDTQPRLGDTTTDDTANDSSTCETPDNETPTTAAMTDETETDKAEESHSDTEHETSAKPSKKAKDKSVRVNFLLDERRYKKLAILAVLEDMSLTDLLKEGIDLCIAAHDTQATIAGQAISQSENARSE